MRSVFSEDNAGARNYVQQQRALGSDRFRSLCE